MNNLTLDEHIALGRQLATLRREITSADRWNKYKKNCWTNYHLRKVEKEFNKVRSKQEDLLFKQLPAVARLDAYYCGPDWTYQGLSFASIHSAFVSLMETVNDKVPAKVIDQWLKCERALWMLASVAPDYEAQDLRKREHYRYRSMS